MQMEKIKVFLVGSQVLYREGMRMSLAKEHDIEVIGETDDGEEALEQMKPLSPDSLLHDPGALLRRAPPGTPDAPHQERSR